MIQLYQCKSINISAHLIYAFTYISIFDSTRTRNEERQDHLHGTPKSPYLYKSIIKIRIFFPISEDDQMKLNSFFTARKILSHACLVIIM